MKLPPPTIDPPRRTAQLVQLGGAHRRLLDGLIGDAAVFCLLQSGTKIDVGSWFFKRPVWVCLTDREMLLFAAGRRPYIERISLEQLGQSEYNHVTGQLVLAPVESQRVGGLKLPPLLALQLLSQLCRGDKQK